MYQLKLVSVVQYLENDISQSVSGFVSKLKNVDAKEY